MYVQNITTPLVTTSTTTPLTLPNILTTQNQLLPITTCLVSITNPTSGGQSISSGTLVFSDTVGGVTSSITYSLSGVSLAAGANQVFYISLSNGILQNVKLNVVFASQPSAGTLSVTVNYQ
jgi:hypothetical protein